MENKPLENQDEDLIEGKNKILPPRPFPKPGPPPISKNKIELNWWKGLFFNIIKFDDCTVIERLKIILRPSVWNKIEKEYEKWKKENKK